MIDDFTREVVNDPMRTQPVRLLPDDERAKLVVLVEEAVRHTPDDEAAVRYVKDRMDADPALKSAFLEAVLKGFSFDAVYKVRREAKNQGG